MNTAPLAGVLLLFALAVVGSAWYIAFRLRTTFGLQRRWLLRVLVLAALVGSFMLMVPATKSADLVAGLLYVFGGYLLAGYVFLTLAFVLLHVIERAWHIANARVGAAALLLAAGATRGHGHFSIHSRPVSPRPAAGLRVARGRNVHVSRSTRHLKRAEHPAIEADTAVMI